MAEEKGVARSRMAWAATPANRARASADPQARARTDAGRTDRAPNRARGSGCDVTRVIGRRKSLVMRDRLRHQPDGSLATVGVIILVIGRGAHEAGQAATWTLRLTLALGVLFALLAVKQWRDRPRPGEAAELPAWMAKVGRFSPGRCAGLAAYEHQYNTHRP